MKHDKTRVMNDFIDECVLAVGDIPVSTRGRAIYALTATPEQLKLLEELRAATPGTKADVIEAHNEKDSQSTDDKS